MVRYLNSIWPGKVNEHTASRLCIFSIDLQVEEKFDLVDRVSHQAIVLQFILELAKSLKIDPRGCFRQFFIKFAQTDNPEYHKAFNDELEAFRGNIWLILYESYYILGGYEIIFMNIQEEYEKELKLELKLIWRNTKKKKKQNVSQHLQAV